MNITGNYDVTSTNTTTTVGSTAANSTAGTAKTNDIGKTLLPGNKEIMGVPVSVLDRYGHLKKNIEFLEACIERESHIMTYQINQTLEKLIKALNKCKMELAVIELQYPKIKSAYQFYSLVREVNQDGNNANLNSEQTSLNYDS